MVIPIPDDKDKFFLEEDAIDFFMYFPVDSLNLPSCTLYLATFNVIKASSEHCNQLGDKFWGQL